MTNIGEIDDKTLQDLINNPDYNVMWDDSILGHIRVDYYPERAKARAEFNALSPDQKTEIGRSNGYGSCLHCHNTWNWKKGHVINYTADYTAGGMFPLCEECHKKLSPQERFDYCKKLYYNWSRPEKRIEWNTIAEHVGLRDFKQTTKESDRETNFLDEITVDEVPCDYKRVAKKLGTKYARLKRKLRVVRNSHWEFVRILRRKIMYQKKEIKELRKIIGVTDKRKEEPKVTLSPSDKNPILPDKSLRRTLLGKDEPEKRK
jgi:hypothetical protein